MAQVKFIQLGTETNKIAKGDYASKLAQTKTDYPGAIIFATYEAEDGSTAYEIYANGQKYPVGGGGGGVVYVGDAPVTDGQIDTATDTSKKVYKDGWKGTEKTDSTYNAGDIYMYAPDRTNDTSQTSGYVYVKSKKGDADNSHWEALAGAVSAENVWFNNGILRTIAFGVKKAPASGSTIDNKDTPTNLKTFLEYYICEAQSDTGTYAQTKFPTYTATFNLVSATSGDYQLNSTLSKTYTWTPDFKTQVNNVDTTNLSYQNVVTCTSSKGYGFIQDGKDITGQTITTSSDKVNYVETTPSDATIQLKIENITGSSVTYSGSTSDCSITYSVDTSTLGTNKSYQIQLATTYLSKCSLAWTNSKGESVTSISVPEFSDTYFKTNVSGKGDQVKYSKSSNPKISSTITLPTTNSTTVSSVKATYGVYLKALWMKRADTSSSTYSPHENTKQEDKYYGSLTTLSFTMDYAHSETTDLSYFYIPYSATVKNVTLGGQSAKYSVTDNGGEPYKYTYDNVENKYKKITLDSSCASGAVLAITLT